MRKTILIFSCCAFFALAAMARRTEALLEKNWKFTKGDVPEATQTNFDDSKWETVTIPHDWAIFGPFDRNNDLQEVAVTQDLEKQASVKTGCSTMVSIRGRTRTPAWSSPGRAGSA